MNGKEEIKNNLEILPGSIADKEKELLKLQEEQRDLEILKKDVENRIYIEVDAETDEHDKKKFSNDIKRRAETEKRLILDKTFLTASDNHKKSTRAINQLQVDVGFLKRTFRAMESFCRLGE